MDRVGERAELLRVAEEGAAERAERLRERMGDGSAFPAGEPAEVEASVFVARTARLRGRVSLGAGSSVLFRH